MAKKHEKEELDPFAYSVGNIYQQINNNGQVYYYNYQTKQSQYQIPPPGAKIFTNEGFYIQPEINRINDMEQSANRKLGPLGSNLFIFHLPNHMKDSDLYKLFQRFGNILSARVMTENGKSKGMGFVSFDNQHSAQAAIQEMNGFDMGGKRLKV